MAELNWNLARTPDMFGAALQGMEAGQKVGRRRALDAAMGQVDLDRPETITPVLRLDPPTGQALLGTSLKLADSRRSEQGRQAYGDVIAARTGRPTLVGGGGASLGALTGGMLNPSGGKPRTLADITGTSTGASKAVGAVREAGTTDLEPEQPDIVVSGRPRAEPAPSLAGDAAERLARINPQLHAQVMQVLGRLDENQRKQAADRAQALGVAAMQVSGLPFEERRDAIEEMAPMLMSHGISAEEIEGFDPTDDALDNMVEEALGTKGILQRLDRDRAFGLQQDRFEESRRHNATNEGVAASRVAVSREGMVRADARGRRGQDIASADRRRGQDIGATRSRTRGGSAGAPAANAAPVKVRTLAEAMRLPPGTSFMTPDGRVKVR